MKNKDIWKAVVGYEGLYEVSEGGQVRSIDRYVTQWTGTQLKKGRVLKPSYDRSGYVRVALSKNNKLRTIAVHRIVALAFVENSKCYTEVNHKDCNKENNSASNLEWCSRLENIRHAVDNNLIKYHSGDSHHNTVIKSLDREKIKSLYDSGIKVSDLKEMYNCHYCTIYRILNLKKS